MVQGSPNCPLSAYLLQCLYFSTSTSWRGVLKRGSPKSSHPKLDHLIVLVWSFSTTCFKANGEMESECLLISWDGSKSMWTVNSPSWHAPRHICPANLGMISLNSLANYHSSLWTYTHLDARFEGERDGLDCLLPAVNLNDWFYPEVDYGLQCWITWVKLLNVTKRLNQLTWSAQWTADSIKVSKTPNFPRARKMILSWIKHPSGAPKCRKSIATSAINHDYEISKGFWFSSLCKD